LLEILTAGFYRFWLSTDIRRHLWSNTSVDGEALKYTGTSTELLFGFLIAIAVLLPIYIAHFALSLELPAWKALIVGGLFVCFYFFGNFAVYYTLRYRMSRTMWRGVGFRMAGSSLAYAARATAWGIAMILTLGLIQPWRIAALERYKLKNSFYGNLQGCFQGRGTELFKQAWWIWAFGSSIAIVCFFVPMFSIVALLVSPVLLGLYRSAEIRWRTNGIHFSDVSFQSKLSRTALIGIHIKAASWFVLMLIAFVIYFIAGVEILAAISDESPQDFIKAPHLGHNLEFVTLIIIGYLIQLYVLKLILRIYLIRDLWAIVTNSTAVSGLSAVYSSSFDGRPSTITSDIPRFEINVV